MNKRSDNTGTAGSRKAIPQRTAEAVLLNTYLSRNYDGEAKLLSKATNISVAQIKRWVSKNAVVINKAVFLKASKLSHDERQMEVCLTSLAEGAVSVDFNDHLRVKYGSNQSLFADETGLLQQQVNRWTQRDCVFLENNVYRKQRDLFATDGAVSAKKKLH
jgi:hypothetical protein